MKWRSTMALALAVGAAAPTLLMAQDTRPGVAVMKFINGGSYGQDAEDFEALRVGLQQLMLTELSMNSSLRLVDRAHLEQIMDEQDLNVSGRVDANTAARLGRLVGARYMVMGSFTDLWGEMTLTANIVDTETGEIIKAEKANDKREEIYQMMVELADKVTRGANLPPLPKQAMELRQKRDIPGEAIRLYNRALLQQERGNTEKAIELFSKVISDFPQYTEAQVALQQIRQG